MNEKVVVMANRTIDEENVKIGRLLQDARESHGVLQSELCEATGLTKNHISAVERGVSKANIRMLSVSKKPAQLHENTTDFTTMNHLIEYMQRYYRTQFQLENDVLISGI